MGVQEHQAYQRIIFSQKVQLICPHHHPKIKAENLTKLRRDNAGGLRREMERLLSTHGQTLTFREPPIIRENASLFV